MKQGDLDFDEFCDAYNAMIDKLGDLHASIREKAIQQSMILGMAQDDDAEYEELLEQTKGRFDKPTWICRLEELLGARGWECAGTRAGEGQAADMLQAS